MAKQKKYNIETITRSVPKPLQEKSEDAFCYTENYWAVADGAGGVGIFAAEWAKYLLEKLPKTPFAQANEMIQWANEIWEEFYQTIDNQELAVEIKSKFIEEGSLATLIAAYYDGKRLRAISYGDSALLLYNAKKNTLRALPSELNTYVKNPFLINWKEEILPEGIKTMDFSWKKQEQILLCSDALAQFLLLAFACLNPKSDWEAQLFDLQKTHQSHRIFQFVEKINQYFDEKANFDKDIWLPLCEAMKTEETFKQHVYQLCEQGLIPNDDYTAVLVKKA
jgi:hypothetical protein